MSWTERRDELQALARETDKSCRLVPIGLKLGVAFTVGCWIFIPRHWTYEQALSVMPHEAQHVRQHRWCGLFIHPVAGIPLFMTLYFLVPFPTLLAWFRYRLELNACENQWVYLASRKDNPATPTQLTQLAIDRANVVSGWLYVFSVPRPWARWGYTRKVDVCFRAGRVKLLASLRSSPRGY